MDSTGTHRPMTTAISLAAASLIAFTTTATAPTLGTSAGPPVPRISVEAVQLTALPVAFEQVWAIATGKDSSYPLPVGSNPVAPITEQLVRTVATYGTQLLTGQFAKIPAEFSAQFEKLTSTLPTVQALIAEAVAVVPIAIFSAAFATALVIGSLPASVNALSGLPTIWINAAIAWPLKIVYNAFAIRNTIAMALQPLQPPQPEPTAAMVASAPESTARNVDPRPPRATASSGPRASKRATASSAATVSEKTAPAPARSTAASGSTPDTKHVDNNHRSHHRAARTSGSA